MLSMQEKALELDELFAGSGKAEELRAQRVWRFVIVMWMTWLFNTGFLWWRGYEQASEVCVFATLAHLAIVLICWQVKHHAAIMYLSLITSTFGLFFVSLSDPALSSTMFFFPISIVVASQLLGVASAFVWLLVNIAAFVLFFIASYGLADVFGTSRLDDLMMLLGVPICVFFCCQQGERYYQQRTRNLFELSQKLQKKSEVLHELATTDALTGLINRFQFQKRLKETIDHAQANSESMALFLIDMDGFKEINDTLGHPVGDTALVEIANQLNEAYGKRADVARLGGDEFCVIYPGVRDEDHAAWIANRIYELLTHRYVLEAAEFPMGASVGYALSPLHTQSDHELLAFADTAMFHAKEQKLGHACYVSEMTDRLVTYRTMQEHLSVALENGEFFLEYQPQVNMRTGEVDGVEALLRWNHDGQVIPPYRFIHLLEQSREIVPVSNWIVRVVCRQIAEWREQGYDVRVSVNVSAVQFDDEDFCKTFVDSIQENDISPACLDCEITEGLLIDNVEQAVEKLTQIKDLGISISIDDFGTGYSSLAYLRQFPLDKLKIDRAFIKDIPNEDDGVIASSIIVLARALELKVVAEGVETQEHIDFLNFHDCDEYQGFFKSRPVSANEVTKHFTKVPAEMLC